jgi:hypothetical protein
VITQVKRDRARLLNAFAARRRLMLASLTATCICLAPLVSAPAALIGAAPARADVAAPRVNGGEQTSPPEKASGSSLEDAAAKAGDTGRAVAMSLIGLAFAFAATVLAFRRDFKEAAGVFAVGLVSVLLATSTGVSLIRETVKSIFGG